MRCRVVATAFGLLFTPSTVLAHASLSIEIGGAVAASSIHTGYSSATSTSSGIALAASALRVPSSATTSNGTSVGGITPDSPPASGIGVGEVRPTALFDIGLLIGLGFRAGKVGFGDTGTALIGGDVSLGLQRRIGPVVPFIAGRVGFNSYNAFTPSVGIQRATDLRADALLGARLYLTQQFYLSADLFVGYGDRFGGAVAFGWDILQSGESVR
jgi:hypothetical protein